MRRWILKKGGVIHQEDLSKSDWKTLCGRRIGLGFFDKTTGDAVTCVNCLRKSAEAARVRRNLSLAKKRRLKRQAASQLN